MQVELSTVLAVFGSGLGLYVGLLRYTIASKEQSYVERFGNLEKDTDHIKERLVNEEKNTIRLDGELKLAQNNHDQLTDTIDEIKKSMITKVEFEPRMTNLERTLNQILSELQRTGGRFPSGQMSSTTPPKPR